VENRLHWVLDVFFRKDLARLEWAAKHGHHPPYRAQSDLAGQTVDQSEDPEETRRLECRSPRSRHPPDCVTIKRFARTPLRKGERLRDNIEAQLAKTKTLARLVRSLFKVPPSIAYITDY
jgi:hypothetical protein